MHTAHSLRTSPLIRHGCSVPPFAAADGPPLSLRDNSPARRGNYPRGKAWAAAGVVQRLPLEGKLSSEARLMRWKGISTTPGKPSTPHPPQAVPLPLVRHHQSHLSKKRGTGVSQYDQTRFSHTVYGFLQSRFSSTFAAVWVSARNRRLFYFLKIAKRGNR